MRFSNGTIGVLVMVIGGLAFVGSVNVTRGQYPASERPMLLSMDGTDSGAQASLRRAQGVEPHAVFVTDELASDVAASPPPAQRSIVCGNVRRLGGPEGGLIRIIVEDPLDPQTIYLGTFTGGIQKSTDAGASWTAINTGLDQIDFRALAVHPTQTNILLAAGFAGGPVRSEDGGETWAASSTGAPLSTGIEFAFDPTDSSRVYYASTTTSTLHVSTDTGNTWTSITLPAGAVPQALALDPTDPNILFVGTYDGLFRSTDQGGSWTEITTGFSGVSNKLVRDIVFDAQNPSLVYLAFFSHVTGANGGLYLSLDGGLTWASANTGVPTYVNFDYHCLAVDPVNEGHAYAAILQRGVYKSTSSGASWTQMSSGMPAGARYVTTVTTSAVVDRVYAGDGTPDRGLYLSQDAGANWERRSNGLYADYANALVADPFDETRFYFGGRGAIYRREIPGWNRLCADSLPTTNTVNRVYSLIAPGVSALYTSHTLLAASGVFVSFDDGATCVDRPNGTHWTRGLGNDPSDSDRVFTTTWSDGVFESADAGLTWVDRNLGLSHLTGNAFLVSPDDPLRLYYGSSNGGMYRSMDGGASWSQVNTGISGADIDISDIDFDPADSTHLYIANYKSSNNNVYQSFDGGDTWQLTSNGILSGEIIRKLVVAPTNPDLLVGLDMYGIPLSGQPADTYLYLSRDAGQTWEVLASDRLYTNFAILPTDPPTVIAAAVGEGVFRLCLSPCGDLDVDGDVDLADFVLFAGCFSGSGSPAPAGCECSDFDDDGDVDLADFVTFATNFTG